MSPTEKEIGSDTFKITFESDFSLITYTGKWDTFTESTWCYRNGRDYEQEALAVEFFIDGVYDENDNQLFTFPNLEGQIHDILLENANASE